MTLTPDSKFKITVGMFTVVIGWSAYAGWKVNDTISRVNQSIKDVNDKITNLESSVADRFTKTAAAEWALRIVVSNPTLKIPDPRDPSRLLGFDDDGMKIFGERQNVAADWRMP